MNNPFYHDTVIRLAQEDEAFQGIAGKKISIPIAIHPDVPATGVIVINYPGCMGDIDGYANKYRKLAEHVQKNVGAVIRSGNHIHTGFDYGKSIQHDLNSIIDYAIANSMRICCHDEPNIYLMGFSAGASAIAAVAHQYPQVKKILLIAPSGDAGEDVVTEGLSKYPGEVYIVGAAQDDVVGPKAAPHYFFLVKTASASKVVIVQNCDHQFRGRENGMIMSKAPLWAFLGDESFPSPEGGIVLYE